MNTCRVESQSLSCLSLFCRSRDRHSWEQDAGMKTLQFHSRPAGGGRAVISIKRQTGVSGCLRALRDHSAGEFWVSSSLFQTLESVFWLTDLRGARPPKEKPPRSVTFTSSRAASLGANGC